MRKQTVGIVIRFCVENSVTRGVSKRSRLIVLGIVFFTKSLLFSNISSCVSIFLCLFYSSFFSQSSGFGTWNILNIKYTLNENAGFFAEAQLRSLKFYTHFHYYEYKGGFNYLIQKNLTFSIGTGSYQTYKEGGNFVLPKNNDEIRLWPQVLLSQSIGNIKIEQRYRTEFRFTGNGYRNRFRYRFGLAYPFGKEKNEFKPFQTSLTNELFFTNKEPYFERNRLSIAFNFRPIKTISLQLAYLYQFDYKINDETGRDFLQVGLFIELDKANPTH